VRIIITITTVRNYLESCKEEHKIRTSCPSLEFWVAEPLNFVVSNPENLLDHGRRSGAFTKKFARGITPPLCCGSGAGADEPAMAGLHADPGLVSTIPGVVLKIEPFPFLAGPPFAYALKAVKPGPIDTLRTCCPGVAIMGPRCV